MKMKVLVTFNHLSGGKTYEKGKTYDVEKEFFDHILAVGPYVEAVPEKVVEDSAKKPIENPAEKPIEKRASKTTKAKK